MFISKKKYKELLKRIEELEEQHIVPEQEVEFVQDKETEELNTMILEELNTNDPMLPILIIRFGDKNKGWIPGEVQIKSFVEQIKARKLHEVYNILIFNHALSVEVVDTLKYNKF